MIAIILVIVVAVVILIAILLMGGGGGGGSNTPEGAIENFVDAWNDGDAEKVISGDIISFLPQSERGDIIDAINRWADGQNIEVYDLSEISHPDMIYTGDASFDSVGEMINEIESELDVEVDDCKVYEGMIRIEESGDVEIDDITFVLVEIGGKWYTTGLYFE